MDSCMEHCLNRNQQKQASYQHGGVKLWCELLQCLQSRLIVLPLLLQLWCLVLNLLQAQSPSVQ